MESLGGTYHQVVGDDVPRALLDFARGVNATQLVLGASRRGRFAQIFLRAASASPPPRLSGPIDVHLVTHEAGQPRAAAAEARRARLTARRRLAGFAVAAASGCRC